jgi:hypothetical protein
LLLNGSLLPNDSPPPNDPGHTSIDKNASIDKSNVDLRLADVIKRGTAGVDLSYL